MMTPSNEMSIVNKIHLLYDSIDYSNSEFVRGRLKTLISELINNDFSSLVQLLYRIDVDEKKLKQHLRVDRDANSAAVIADLIIQRQLQKIATKNKFSGEKPAGDEERW